MGSYVLRRRQRHQDDEAIRHYNERLNAENAERRLKHERRCKVVDDALITITVVVQKPKLFGTRNRSSTLETDVTYESSTSLDSSPGFSSQFMRNVSDSSGGDEEDCLNLGATELISRASIFSISCSSAASDALNMAHEEFFVLDNPIAPKEWNAETCAICLESYKENDSVSYSKHQNCAHAFHTHCILSWLKDECRNDCPYCRGPYLNLCVVEEGADFLGGNSLTSTIGAEAHSHAASNDNVDSNG